jgi:flagellar basal body rod protein FlgG
VAQVLLSRELVMLHGIYVGASSLTALQRMQDVISKNISSSEVTGFKRTEMSFEGVLHGATKFGAKGNGAEELGGAVPTTVQKLDFTPGELKWTGVSTDFAIRSQGFFQLRRPDGTLVYTRGGEFLLNQQNALVNKDGFELQSGAGPVELDPEQGPVSVSSDGMLSQGRDQLGRLQLFEFPDPGSLTPVGGGCFVPKNGVVPVQEENPVLDQGAIEGANVSALKEMVNMIGVSRAYEASMKVVSSHDDLMKGAIQSLGSPTV